MDTTTKEKLCLLSRDMKQGVTFQNACSEEYLDALDLVEKNMSLSSGACYENNDVARQIANHLKSMCINARSRQNERRKKGRTTMQQDICIETLISRVLSLFRKQEGRCHVSMLPICFFGKNGHQLSIDRIDNAVGYEDECNLSLVADIFQAELSKTEGEEFVHLKWDRELFKNYGDQIYGGKLTIKYNDIDDATPG